MKPSFVQQIQSINRTSRETARESNSGTFPQARLGTNFVGTGQLKIATGSYTWSATAGQFYLECVRALSPD